MNRITRNRRLTKEEADKYDLVRKQVELELPDLIKRHNERMAAKKAKMSDNFYINIASSGREHFEMAMKIAFSNCAGGIAEAYKITAKKGLVFYWHKENGDKESQSLPYPMDLAAATEFAWNWLKTANYGEEPDHDGSNSPGWRVYNEAWGHVDSQPYAFVGILPEWMMHGK